MKFWVKYCIEKIYKINNVCEYEGLIIKLIYQAFTISK